MTLDMSKLYQIKVPDLLKGALVAAGTVIFANLYPTIQSGTLPTIHDITVTLPYGLAAFVSYIGKNFFTNSAGSFATKEPS